MAFLGGVIGPMSAKVVEKWGIDDAVGAVSVHGTCGIVGVLALGVLGGGYPQFSDAIPTITFTGQLLGCLVMIALGFIPGYVLAMIFKSLGILRASEPVQEMGMDTEIANTAYPEHLQSDLRVPDQTGEST